MKRIELTVKDFYLFKDLAEQFHFRFNFEIVRNIIIVEADSKSLEKLGYVLPSGTDN